MTKKTIVISSVIAAVIGSNVVLKKIRNTKLEKYLRNVFISIGLPNKMAADLAKIGIKYRFDRERRKKLFTKYCEEHFNDIDTDHLIKINESLEDLKIILG